MKILTWSLTPLQVFCSVYLDQIIGFPYDSLADADSYANEMCDLVDRHPASQSHGCARGEFQDNVIRYVSHSGKEYFIAPHTAGGYVVEVPEDSSILSQLIAAVKDEWKRASHCEGWEQLASNPVVVEA